MPLPLTVSYFSKIQIAFTFLIPLTRSSEKRPLNARARVCVCVTVCKAAFWPSILWFRPLLKQQTWISAVLDCKPVSKFSDFYAGGYSSLQNATFLVGNRQVCGWGARSEHAACMALLQAMRVIWRTSWHPMYVSFDGGLRSLWFGCCAPAPEVSSILAVSFVVLHFSSSVIQHCTVTH